MKRIQGGGSDVMVGATVENELPNRKDGFITSPRNPVGFSSTNIDGAYSPPNAALRFRRFTVKQNARQLLADGQPVSIGSRAFDLLLVLLQARGQIVSKADIFRHVWPSTTVDESNLRFQMTSLRAVLGKDRDIIKTIPGRGYLLIAETAFETQTSGAEMVPAHSWLERPPASRTVPILPARPTVAIIDDDHGVRESLEGLLLSAGLAAKTFGSAQEFREHEWANPPACLILDVWLPGISGIDFNDELIAEGRQPPVIFISGHADVHTSVRAMKAGAVEFLTKPVRHQELLDTIQSVLPH